jgi:undecaprenyl diphosphate synthase
MSQNSPFFIDQEEEDHHLCLPFSPDLLPQHIAMIMDGNGRWATRQGLDRSAGHQAGTETVNHVVRWCRKWGIRYLTLYAFSEQNWGRPDQEVSALMSLLADYLQSQRSEILANRIRLCAIGDLNRLPKPIQTLLTHLIQESKHHKGMTLTLALSYGGREEMTRAIQAIAVDVQKNDLNPQDITPTLIQQYLYFPTLPDPDLIIRTSGELRLSNFLLWQSAYSEFHFFDLPWPDLTFAHLKDALIHYAQRDRRFGLVHSSKKNTL